jgi:dCTP deaminase|tara:strand:+ start:46732 stop:47409 length:678 start_codon:yes stop_codon:yes gene_type:complete
MALSDKDIIEKRKKGLVVIEPFKKENLSTSSYDVTLGEYYFREQVPRHYRNLYNIYNKKHADAVWGTKPHKAEAAEKVFSDLNFEFKGIGKKEKIILLEPGETILAHTDEFIGGRRQVTTMMKARSSLGRNFIEVCKCAGWGDVGYTNRWTMEITNNSRNYVIPLVVGRRIAQIIFFETGELLGKDYTEQTSKYQSSTTLSQLKKEWEPKMMLPKLHKDRDIPKK